jgi:hypothetical protein
MEQEENEREAGNPINPVEMEEKRKQSEIIEKVAENLERWMKENDVRDFIRTEDRFYRYQLEYDRETGDVLVGLYSGNSWTEGMETLYEFPNAQDLANIDTSELTSYTDVLCMYPDADLHNPSPEVEKAMRESEIDGLALIVEDELQDVLMELYREVEE